LLGKALKHNEPNAIATAEAALLQLSELGKLPGLIKKQIKYI
jgi:hypothetical protein